MSDMDRVPSEREVVARVVEVRENPVIDVPNTSAAGFTTPPNSRVSSVRATSPMASSACGARELILLLREKLFGRASAAERRRESRTDRRKSARKSVGETEGATTVQRPRAGCSAMVARHERRSVSSDDVGKTRPTSGALSVAERRAAKQRDRREKKRVESRSRACPPMAVATMTAAAARRARRRATRRTSPT